jgi:nanoRNase/pAp phosphatase (c-di-AMP/oligoRNAs hydrolase)
MSSEIRSLLDSKSNILLIPSPHESFDIIPATLALANALEQNNKQVSIYLEVERFKKYVTTFFKHNDFDIVTVEDLSNIVLKIDNIDANIKDITWKTKGRGMDIIIETDSDDDLGNDIELAMTKRDYDLVILIGFNKPKLVKNLFDKNPDLFKSEKVIVIESNKQKELFGFQNYPVKTPNKAQTIFYFIREFNLPISEEASTLLLGSIYFATNSLVESCNTNTFSIVMQLLERGADMNIALSFGVNNINPNNTKYISYIFSKLKALENDVFYSVVEEKDITFYPKEFTGDLVPISKITGCKVAFVIFKYNTESYVYFKSNTSEINLIEVFLNTNYKGGKGRGNIKSNKSLEELINYIKEKIASYRDNNTNLEIESKQQSRGVKGRKQNQIRKSKTKITSPKSTSSMKNTNSVNQQSKTISTNSSSSAFDPLAPANQLPQPIRFEGNNIRMPSENNN